MTDWKQYVRERLPTLPLGPEREAQIVDEMSQHLEAVYEDALCGGASRQEAFNRASAHIKDWRLLECELIRAKRPLAGPLINSAFARAPQLRPERRKAGTAMESVLQDLRYGVRMLVRHKALATVAIVSLGLAIGANSAMFSLVDAVVLKTLPVKNPHELVLFEWVSGESFMASTINGTLNKDKATGLSTSTSLSYDTFKQFRDHSQTMTEVIAFAELEQLTIKADGQVEVATGQVVSGSYYGGLGVAPVAGRLLADDDDHAGSSPVAVISYRYWRRRFGLDPETVGKRVDINGVPFEIVGIAPRGFEGTLQIGASPDVTVAIAMEPRIRALSGSLLEEPGAWWLQIMGRLKPGATLEQTRLSLEALFQQSAIEGYRASVAQSATKPNGGAREQGQGEPSVPQLKVTSGSQGLNEARTDYASSLLILTAVVGLVLLIACANVATLLLSRAANRQKEIAIRLALGASRFRVIRQLLTESLLLAGLGGALGVLLAQWGKDVLLSLRPWGGGTLALELRLDWRVLGFTALLAVLTACFFGLVPAFRATRMDVGRTLKDTARSLVGGRFGLTKGLVVVQVALSLLLLIAAGLFARTLSNLNSLNVGFNTTNLLLFRVDPRLSGYKKDRLANLYQRMLERVDAVPGVKRATLSRHPLLSGSAAIDMAFIDGKPMPTAALSIRDMTWIQRVRANFLDTMEIPILIGRGLQDSDDERAPKVAVINQTMARKCFGDQNPIGQRFGFSPEHSRDIEIVGVARDAKYSSIRMETPNTVYLPYLQDLQGLGQMNFEVRTTGDPSLVAPSIREAIQQVDENLPLFSMQTQTQQNNSSLASERLFATLSSFFGGLALLLATIGLYGVMSYSVATRTNEIGIRMALGARPLQVVALILRETMLLVVIGVVLGVGGAIASTRLIKSMLFGLTPNDPVTIALGVLVMITVSAAAGYLPARRASRVDPLNALRHE